jgi:ketosteroid isomerase-like protein
MRNLRFVATLALAIVPAVAQAAPATPVAVVQHHVAAMKKGDLPAIMSDYAPDAVVVAPHGLVSGVSARGAQVFVGSANARRVFATLTDKVHHPGVVTMQTAIEPGGPGVALLHWVQFKGTAQQVAGEDVFVVRGGRIVHQAILVGAE